MSKNILQPVLAGIALLFSAACGAVDFKPFDGFEGYQDIKVSDNVYYVGFHGKRDAKYNEVTAAWSVRSGQLCSQAGASHYVELSHLLEPLTQKELDLFVAFEPAPRMTYAAGGFVYIPIYVPSGPRSARIDAPSKLAPIRCIRATDNILAKDRLVSALEKAK